MVRMIAVNGIKVEKCSCTIAFRVWPRFGGSSIAGEGQEITHDTMYKLLDAAMEVIEKDIEDKLAVLDMGNGILIDVWEVKR